MNVKWTDPLRPGQRANPVIHAEVVAEDLAWANPTEDELVRVFPTAGASLKTWGGEGMTAKNRPPHWIGVRKQTPLHTDPKYPRFSHHLIVRVDAFVLRGLSKEEVPLVRGTYVVIDTHSPHQLFATGRGALWYVAVSLDADWPVPAATAIPMLSRYAATAPFLTDRITTPNNGGRFAVPK